ncbi:MAG: hypothetical protein HY331_13650 [Chloroflexi bacterium]|nr:hypothetical protein [Chloroflexota bacterium]
MQGIGYPGIRGVVLWPLLIMGLAVATWLVIQRVWLEPPALGGAAVQIPVVAQDETVRGFGLALNLTAASVDPESGSVDVAISIAKFGHAGPDETAIAFSPRRDLVLADVDGNRYHLDWAQHPDQITLKAGQRTELVRARFTGPVDQAKGKGLLVGVRNLPGIDGGTWLVPIPRSGS